MRSAFAALAAWQPEERGSETLTPLADSLRYRCVTGLREQQVPGAWLWDESLGFSSDRTKIPPHVHVAGALRLDNRSELKQQLGLDSAPACDDRALVALAYGRWGTDLCSRLEGDFAFVLWDEQQRRLVGARDRVGVAPFYYATREGRWCAAATELRTLRFLPEVSSALDELRIAQYLAVYFEDQERTFFRDIRRLPPGMLLVADHHGVQLSRYWEHDPSFELKLVSEADYADKFREIFVEAVRCRSEHDPDPGLLLSGGLDSVSVLGALQHLRGEAGAASVTTISAVFPGQHEADEVAYVDEALRSHEGRAERVPAHVLSPLGADDLLETLDEPFHVPNLFIYWELARQAQQAGVTTLLDGVDGDTTVSHGLEYLPELLRRGRWVQFLKETRWLARRLRGSTLAYAWRFGALPLLHAPTPLGRTSQLTSQLAARVGWSDFARSVQAQAPRLRTLRDSHHAQVTSGILPFYLEVNDKVAAHFGIDHSHPFYDRRLMEFCLSLPPELRLHRGWDRRVQRLAVAGLVPRNIQWRLRKAHWGSNFEARLIADDASTVDRVLADAEGALGQYVQLPELRESWQRCRNRTYQEQDLMSVWVATTLGLWLERVALGQLATCLDSS